MTESKYEPGPWFVHCRLDEPQGTMVMAPGEQDNFIVCTCDHERHFPEINYANARLIAAAPDLLEAAQELTARYPLDPELTRLQLAIHKAGAE